MENKQKYRVISQPGSGSYDTKDLQEEINALYQDGYKVISSHSHDGRGQVILELRSVWD